jgi:hypothetical protein
VDAPHHHARPVPLVAILGRPAVLLKPAVDEQRIALVDVLVDVPGDPPVGDAGEEVHGFLRLAVLAGPPPVDRQGELDHRRTVRRVAELRLVGQPAGQDRPVEVHVAYLRGAL